jgi:NAD(P)-dependent dehydrogenase (short-subunit alcohol dehydrogenase family)
VCRNWAGLDLEGAPDGSVVTMAADDLLRTPFGATSTAAEVLAGVDLTGRIAVVTGGASGIGVETVRALAAAGAQVTIGARRVAEAQRVAASVDASGGQELQFAAYWQAKTANVLFAVEAARRWADDGIVANALMPGGIFTQLQRHVGGSDHIAQARVRFADASVEVKTAEQGAATSVLLAASPLVRGVTGRYFEDCREAEVVTERTPTTLGGVAPYALDPENAGRLWETSLALTR